MTDSVISPGVATVAEIQRFFARTTMDSRRARFHRAVARIPQDELDGLTRIRADRVNVIARADHAGATRPPTVEAVPYVSDLLFVGDLLGVASGSMLDHTTAEVSVWVADRCQRQGIARALLADLGRRLDELGVTTVQAHLLASNVAALALADRLVPTATVGRCQDALHIKAELPRFSSPRTAREWSHRRGA